MDKEKIDKMIETLQAIKEGKELEIKVFDTPELWEKVNLETIDIFYRTVNGRPGFRVNDLRVIPKEEEGQQC